MSAGYEEIATDQIRYHEGRRQRLHEKVSPATTMIIDGKRSEVQRIVGGVWRDEPAQPRQNDD